MANIYGFQMKNIKSTLGREGYGCFANLYLNGKKIGTYTDYGDGAMGDATYKSPEAEKEMTEFIVAYAKKNPDKYIVNLYKENPERYKEECNNFKKYHPYISDEDFTIETMSANSIDYIVSDFLDLHEREKKFKKYIKKGYRAVGFSKRKLSAYPSSWSDTKIKETAEGNEEMLYMTLDDFVIR